MNTFQIEQINYTLIRNAHNLNFKEKNLLLGNPNKYVATQKKEFEVVVFIETIGKRDECVELLRQMVKKMELVETFTSDINQLA